MSSLLIMLTPCLSHAMHKPIQFACKYFTKPSEPQLSAETSRRRATFSKRDLWFDVLSVENVHRHLSVPDLSQAGLG